MGLRLGPRLALTSSLAGDEELMNSEPQFLMPLEGNNPAKTEEPIFSRRLVAVRGEALHSTLFFGFYYCCRCCCCCC